MLGNGQGKKFCSLCIHPNFLGFSDTETLFCRLLISLLLWLQRALHVKEAHLTTLTHLEVTVFLSLGPLVYLALLC